MPKLLIAILFTFIGVLIGTHSNDGCPTSFMPAGTYDVSSLTRQFDTKTGEPVYWIIAATIKKEEISPGNYADVRQGDWKFYQIPPGRVKNLPGFKEFFEGEITITD